MSKDLFSAQSSHYAGFRPGYPAKLIDHILSNTPVRTAAWDCATGNGQAAILLAPHFQQVFATDLSENQLLHAFPAPNIRYSHGTAEQSGLESKSVNLVTVAQAFHWFQHEAFHQEVRRVAVPGATIAIWGYGLFETEHPALNKEVMRLYEGILGPYWAREREHVEQRYESLPFPYEPLPSLELDMDYTWDAAILRGFLESWSSVQQYRQRHRQDPLAPWLEEVDAYIQHPFRVSFPLFMKLGKVRAD